MEERRKKISCTNGIVGSSICILGFGRSPILALVPKAEFAFVKEEMFDETVDVRFLFCIPASS